MLIKDPSRGNVFKKTRLINDLQAVDPEKIKIGNHLNTAQQVTLYFRRLATASYTLISGQRWKNAADYVDDALKTVTIRGQDISPFAPFRRQISAFQTVTIGQALVLSVLAVAFVLGLVVYGMAMVAGALAVLIALYLGDLFLMFLLSVQTLSKPAEESIKDQVVYALTDAEWPSYTILCPLYKEVEVVPQFVKAMLDLDYPTSKLQILFLTEADDAETRMALINMHLPAHFVIVTVPAGEPRTKPRACNFGLLQATGDYIVIYDAEDIPDPLQLKKAVLTFIKGGSDLACVQAKLNFYNERQNILTRWFTAEYSLWFDLTLPGLQRAGLPLPLGGTSNHFRAETLRMLGAWDPFNVTEDCDLGLRLAHHNLRTSVLDSTTYEEANSQVKNWLRQRSRWIKGYMQTYLVYMRRPWEYFRGGRLREFLALQLVIGGKTGVLFVNPLMWLLVLLYFCFRPFVGETYHTLFPLPVLYMGTLCLVFGNFFYIYSHLMGCMKRRQYDLIKWTLLIPIYWAMTSVAGFMALYQLIFKPHYWEKTKHGLHLSQTAAPSITALNVLHSAPLAVQAAVPYSSSTGGSMTGRSANSIAAPGAARTVVHTTAPAMPVAPIEKRLTGLVAAPERRSWWRVLRSDPWLLATIGTSMLAGLLALWYFLQHHETTLYGDALSHMLIARRLFDNLTPGLAQLGGVWVPLPHLLMVPFIWNDYLWHTGLAGSLTSFPCYVVASVYIYLSARRLTKHGPASFIGTLLFIVNPNVLYLQTTPMTEPVLIATLTMACYHFLVWAQDGHPIQLILSAAATFLATLSRFDGWALCLALLVFIVVIGKIKRQRWSHLEGNLIIFGTLACFGMLLWMVWCGVIFGDPLYWQRGPFSSQAQQMLLIKAGILYTYHNAWQSLRYFTIDSIVNVGLLTFILGVVALIVFVARRRLSVDTLAVLAYWMPFVFYVVSLYGGQAAIYVPAAVPAHAPHTLYNARYGVEMVAPCAVMVATLISTLFSQRSFALVSRMFSLPVLSSVAVFAPRIPRIQRPRMVLASVFIAIILGQAFLTVQGGIISLQGGQFGLDCSPMHQIVPYMAQHYNGGAILEDAYTTNMDSLEPEANIHFDNFVYEGSGIRWQQALANPAAHVDWIIVNPTLGRDAIARHIDLNSPTFTDHFTLLLQEPMGLRLYHRKGLPSLPTRTIDPMLLTIHARCVVDTTKR